MPSTVDPLPISALPGFEVLDRREAERLARLAAPCHWKAGDRVDYGRDLVIVGQGRLDLSLGPQGGGNVAVGSEGDGGLIGEIGLFARESAPLEARAHDDLAGFMLSRRALKTSFHYSRPLAVKFMVICARGLARKIRAANQALANLPGFSAATPLPAPKPLGAHDLRRLRTLAVARDYRDGDIIFWEGERSRELYVVSEGRVLVVRGTAGAERVLAELGPGDFLGEMAFVDEAPRSAGARAHGTLRLHMLSGDVLDRALEIDTGVALYLTNVLCKVMARRLEATLDRLREADAAAHSRDGASPRR